MEEGKVKHVVWNKDTLSVNHIHLALRHRYKDGGTSLLIGRVLHCQLMGPGFDPCHWPVYIGVYVGKLFHPACMDPSATAVNRRS